MAAAAARKLQKEIETTMKKVEDGLTEFDDCWEQASCVSGRDQKEKLGEELKRCINKLQRWRSQIRDWISANGVQGKDKLENARKRIETDMHRFKDFERELKTKAFSTCGLQRGDELELEEAEKLKYQDWLRETIQCLKDQLEQYEADVEILSSKKSLSSDDKARMATLKTHQERHGWHIEKLELLLRAVDNDSVDMGDLAVLRESVEVYLESHEGPDCYHDESMYDCFDLAQYEDKAQPIQRIERDRFDSEDISAAADAAAGSKEETPKNKKEKDKKKKDDKKEKKKPEVEKKAAATAVQETVSRQSSGKVLETKAAPANANEAKGGDEEKLEPEEEKVQEDQLLSEAEEFICKICQIHVVGCGPKLTSCSHLFCGDCIAQWIAQHPECQTWAQRARAAGPERVVPCPVCKQPLNEKKDLYPVCGLTSRSENLLLWRMLSSLKIMCANHPKVKPGGKCDWIGEYGSYQKHAAVCKNQPSGDASSTRSGGSLTTAAAKVVAPANPEAEAKAEPASRDASRKNTPRSVPATAEAVAEETPSTAAPTQQAAKEQTPTVVASPPQQEPQGNTGGTAKPAPQQQTQTAAVESPPSAADPAPTEVAAGVDAQASAPQQAAAVTAAAQPQVEKTPAPKAQETAPAAATQKAEASVRTDEQSAASGAEATTKGYPEQQDSARTQQAQAKAPQQAVQHSRGPEVIVATRAFEPTSSNMLSVKVGDRLQVSESHATGWTFAVHLSSRAEKQEGWVPSWVVELSQQQAQEEEEQHQSQAKAAAAAQAAAAQAAQQAAAAQAAAAAAAAAAEQRRQQAAREQAAREQAAREQAAREQAAREQAAREQAAREHAARVQAAREQAAREQAAREQAAREQAAREQAAREHALREQAMAQQRAQQLAQHQAQQKARQQAQQAQQAQQGVDGHTRHLTRATSQFNAGTASQMSLSQHELVEVVERHSSGWTYGRKIVRDLTDGSIQEGWFPDWVVRN